MIIACGEHRGTYFHKRYLGVRLGLFVALVFAFLAANSAARAGALDQVVLFNINAATLDQALLQFGAQAHVQISFESTPGLGRIRTERLSGKYTARDALRRLLQGTRLYVIERGHTLAIVESKVSGVTRPVAESGPADPHASDISLSRANGDPREAPNDDDKTDKSRKPALHEVVITGSRLRTTSEQGAQEVNVYGREQIDQSGQNSVADFLTTLPSVSVSPIENASGVGTTVSLRGLPVGTTLVLLDGRRLETSGLAYWTSGGDYFDLNNIPLAAVERIEVVENGSSAVYGSDAIAGVVNIILRKSFDGFEANAKYGWGKDVDTVRTDLAWGKQWDRAGVSVIGSYGIDGGLLNTERLLSGSNDYSNFGGPDNNLPTCFPGNVFSLSGAPLPGGPAGNTATYAAVTGPSESGKPPLSQFTYGALNTCSAVSGLSLLPSTHRASVLSQAHMEIAPAVELFTELMYTHLDQVQMGGYQSLYGLSGFQEYSVSAANPYNPFGVPVGVAESLHEFPLPSDYSSDFFRPLVGIRGWLADRWQWELSAWQSTDWTRLVMPNLVANYAAIQNALDSSDPATALNPFVDGPIAPESLAESLFSNGSIKWMGRDRSTEAFIRGPLVKLPAGEVQAVIGTDYVRSAFDTNDINDGSDPPNTRFNFQRSYYAAFGEARVPIIGSIAPWPGESMLALTIAGRHDQYSGVGGATTKQFGLEFRPLKGLLARATYADAFKAPSLPELYYPDTQSPDVVTDPATGQPESVQLVSGGDSHLRPMTGHSETMGLVYSGPWLGGVTLAATQWRVIENNTIQVVNAQVIVNNEPEFPGRVVRGPSGEIEEVNATDVNFGSIDAAGIDYQATYQHQLGRGVLSTELDATQTYHYTEVLVPGEPAVDGAGVAQDSNDWSPRWKGTVGVGYTRGSLTSHLDGRYTGPYEDYDSTRRIGNFWIFDANLRTELGRAFGWNRTWLRRAYVEGGATNLFNRAPQFSNWEFDYFGFDPAQMSIVGRTLYIETGTRW